MTHTPWKRGFFDGLDLEVDSPGWRSGCEWVTILEGDNLVCAVIAKLDASDLLSDRADRVIRAVNCHANLVAALEAVLTELVGEEFADDIPSVVQARAALARAKE